MPDFKSEIERENEYVRLYEENRHLKRENTMLKANVAEHEHTINSLKGMINRYQEAIVGQALLMSCAMEWDYEACED